LREKILIIASWGLPPSWRSATYKLSITSEGFRRFLEGKSLDYESITCTSRCSTLALASLLSRVADVKVIAFGLDTVVNPSKCGNSSDDLRRCVLDRFKEWLRDLIINCDCCKDLPIDALIDGDVVRVGDMIKVVVTPGIGKLYGWVYEGSVLHIFTIVFTHIIDLLRSDKYSFIIVDLTHGINYQLIATLYGVIAAAIVSGKERNLILMNSEPYPPGSKGEGSVAMIASEVPKLTLLDVTLLQQVIRFIRIISTVVKLRSVLLREALGLVSGGLKEEIVRVENFIRLLEDIVPTITFRNAKYVDGGDLGINICKDLTINLTPTIFKPLVNVEDKVINYRDVSIGDLLSTTLKLFISDLCSKLESEDLLEYLSKVLDIYERDARLTYAKFIVSEELQHLRHVVEFVCKYYIDLMNIPELIKDNLIRYHDQQHVEVLWPLFKALRDNVSKIRKVLAGDMKLNEVLPEIVQISNLGMKREYESYENEVRDLIAHAGISYKVLHSIIVNIKKCRIEEIRYEKELQKLIHHLI